MKLKDLAIALALGVATSVAALAAERGTHEEAKALVAKATSYFLNNGPDKTFATVSEKNGPFVDRDLYVYIFDEAGLLVAHPISPALIGKNLSSMKDVDGKAFVQDILAVKDDGVVSYKWLNPQTKAVDPKTAFVKHAGKFLIVVGAYQ
jgi:cytochrome c